LQQLEQQERVTKQALERESIRKRELQRQVETAQSKVQNLCGQRYDQLIKIEERQQQVEMLLAEKSRLLVQRNELDTLLRDVE
jgi:type IV secretory pathway component VirB8